MQTPPPSSPSPLWAAVDRVVERLSPEQACDHGLGPLAARRRRQLGLPLGEQLVREERAAGAANLVAPSLLARIRDAVDGRIVMFKGPELSRHYPGRARRFGDLDLLPEDAERTQAALLAAGFRLQDRDWPPEGYDDARRPHYHLHPLEWPGVPLRIEVHKEVKWPEGVRAPATEQILRDAVEAENGVPGILVPDPAQHAVLLASHAWGEIPFRRLRQLLDILAFVDGRIPPERLAAAADAWGFRRGWQSTLDVCAWMFSGAPKPLSVRTWARHLETLRDPTVVEMHVQEWVAPFWMMPPRTAARLTAAAVTRDFRPEIGQTWGDKLAQMARALRHPLSSKTDHDRRSARGRFRRKA
jgi:hypothetical protein